MHNTTTLLLVTLLATVLASFPSPTTAQVGTSPWCQSYMANCEDLRKKNCDAMVPNGDRNLTWISTHCSTVTPPAGGCRYFSPDCSCSYTDITNLNRTVMVPLSQPALALTQTQTNNGCLDGNANSTALPTTATATVTVTTAVGAATTTITPTATTKPNMAGDSKKPMAVSLATINVAILIALFL
ncbi:hypothetical protein KI688_012271 [Linnemannia hyalina]|uniref:Uncharacterized protein n=1 Tax=Linnemannia hyalina TaxID=64524 RepID=A0A9P7XVN2_9FUNG|nr:hypothetical protein KI688_012271 [Linnemannia hyalina]